jgi:hypothetical protein
MTRPREVRQGIAGHKQRLLHGDVAGGTRMNPEDDAVARIEAVAQVTKPGYPQAPLPPGEDDAAQQEDLFVRGGGFAALD